MSEMKRVMKNFKMLRSILLVEEMNPTTHFSHHTAYCQHTHTHTLTHTLPEKSYYRYFIHAAFMMNKLIKW